MYFKIECPHCEKVLQVTEEMAGKKRKCPYCQGSLIVPDTTPSEPASSGSQESFGGINVQSSGGNSPSSGPQLKTSVRRKPNEAPRKSSGKQDADGSNVSLLLSGLFGLGSAMVIFVGLYILKLADLRIGSMFWDSALINFPTTLLMCWSFAILAIKSRQLKQQRSAMLLDVLPTELSPEITTGSLDKFVEHIRSLPGTASESMLVKRVWRGIEHFRVRKSAAETVTMMESQPVIDASNVASSYSILKVFIWAMPILGFIGTVMGVSSAVSGLSATLENASDVSAVTASMKGVFGGLGTAFDTTLLALIMSLLVKIPASALQKNEDDLVTTVDEYCNENLLLRLNDGREGGAERGGGGAGVNAKLIQDAVRAAMSSHHDELEKWMKQLARLTEHTASLHQQLAESMTRSTTAVQTNFAGLERGLNSLSSVLGKLGEQQVVVQQVEAPRRSWFSSRKRNGR